SVDIAMPTTPGTYQLRFYTGSTLLATSATISVSASQATATVTVSPPTIGPGGTVTAVVAGGPAKRTDWLALYPTGATTYLSWMYLNGSQTAPPTGVSDAAVPFPMPLTPGTYTIKFFSGSTLLATSGMITVASAASVTVSTTTVTPGGVVTAQVANGPGSRTDWIGVHLAGNPTYVDWAYLNGLQFAPTVGLSAASVDIAMPTTPGTYQLRFYTGSTLLATSIGITVQAPAQFGILTAGECCGRFSIASDVVDGATGTVSQAQVIAQGSGAPGEGRVVAVDPTGRFGYVAIGASLRGYTIDALSGGLTPIAGATFALGGAPPALAVDATGRFLYLADDASRVHGYAIDAASGALTPLTGSPFAVGIDATALVSDPTGHYLYAAGLGVAALTIDATTGALQPIAGSPFAPTRFGAGLAMDPHGRFLYVAGSGLAGYAIDATTGALTPLSGSPFVTATGSYRAVSFDGTGTFLYGSNQNGAAQSLYGFRVDPASGSLSAVPGSPYAVNGGDNYGITAEESGRYVFAIEANNGVIAYRRNAVTGALTQVSMLGPGAFSVAVVRASGNPAATLQALEVTPNIVTFPSSVPGVQR